MKLTEGAVGFHLGNDGVDKDEEIVLRLWIMRQCKVFVHDVEAGILQETDDLQYVFTYSDLRLMSICKPSVSRIVNRVLSCGLPSPRSMATSVLSPTPASSESQ